MLCAFSCPNVAHATSGNVELRVESCTGMDRDQVLRLLDIELKERIRTQPGGQITQLLITCQPAGVLIEARHGRRDAVRALEEEEITGEVGARLLSLTAIEVLREVERAPEPEIVSAPTQTLQKKRGPDARLLVGAEMLSFGLQAPLLGADLSWEVLRFSPVYVRLGATISGGETQLSSGVVGTRLIGGRFEGGLRANLESAGLGVGLGYRLGQARLAGYAEFSDQESGRVYGVWGGPYLGISSDTRLGSALTFKATLELGAVQLPVRGQVAGDRDVTVNGVWAGVGFLVGASF